MYFPSDDTISISYNNTPTPGCAIQAISIEGFQVEIEIIAQLLNNFSATSGIVDSSDSILSAIQKLAASTQRSYTGIHITSGSSATTNLAAFQRGVIFDSNVTGKTVKLRSVSDPDVIPWVEYPIMVMGGFITSNTIGVQTGEYLNNTQNGTYGLTGLLSGVVRASAFTDGSRWFVGP